VVLGSFCSGFLVGRILTIHRLPSVVFGFLRSGFLVGRILTIHRLPSVVFGFLRSSFLGRQDLNDPQTAVCGIRLPVAVCPSADRFASPPEGSASTLLSPLATTSGNLPG
jgi:hypothetical protein